jgi:DNA repair protein RAD16
MQSDETSDASPSDLTESEFGGSDAEADSDDAALTELSSDGESAFGDEISAPIPKGRGKGKAAAKGKAAGRSKAAPRASATRAKGKAASTAKSTAKSTKNGKATRAFAGKGRTLADENADDDSEDPDYSEAEEDDDDAGEEDTEMADEDLEALDDDETRMMTLTDIKKRRREERKAYNQGMEGIRKQEAQMKKKLGRKLTNGEKNIIRLVKVSSTVYFLHPGLQGSAVKADIAAPP